jgi:hypothetical protein
MDEEDEPMSGTNPTTSTLPNTNPQSTTPTTPAQPNPQEAANQLATRQLYAAFERQYLVPLTSPNNDKASLSDALNDMSNLLSARHKRLRDISVEIAKHASSTGQFDALALQRLQLESTTNEQFSQLQKSIFEKMSGAIQAWVTIR